MPNPHQRSDLGSPAQKFWLGLAMIKISMHLTFQSSFRNDQLVFVIHILVFKTYVDTKPDITIVE